MALKVSEKKCFTFMCKVENTSFCAEKTGERMLSPTFVVDAIEKTKWRLWLYPRGVRNGKYIGYFLNREADSKGSETVNITYKLDFVAKDGSCNGSTDFFAKGQGYGYDAIQKREDVFISKRSKFLTQDTLMARCRIWKAFGEMAEDVLCTARTRIGVKKTSFVWNVKMFSTFEAGTKLTYQMNSIRNDAPLMSIDLSFAGGLSCGEIIRFELTLQDQSIKFCTLRLSLIDSSGKKIECYEDEIWFEKYVTSKQFAFSFTRKKLLARQSMYLPGDTLSLKWEWAFSKGVVLEETEEIQYGSTNSKSSIPDYQDVNDEKQTLHSPTLKDNLISLYGKQFLCDVKLKTSTSEFPAHKIILSASTPVFSTMFSCDMKEKDDDCVNIDDLSDDTVRRMLLYIYTESVEDLTWESASRLYVAADKYAILRLKDICCSYLKDHLSPGNACEVLQLADFYADNDLKSDVQDYILKHDADIISSDGWKALMETHLKLAADTLCLRYK